MNIIFFGTSEFAVPALKALVTEKYDIVAVITQPDKPTGRKQTPTPPPVKIAAEKLGLKVLQPQNLKIETLENLLEIVNCKLKIDIGIVAAYGKILPKQFLDAPEYGFINIHPSLLPKYRGPSPIQTAVLNGEAETGVSIMLIDEQIDHGAILVQQKFEIRNSKFEIIAKDLAELGAKLLIETLPKYISGEIKPQPQDHSQATFTKMFTRADGRINWSEPAEKTYNQIRALNPEPGTWTTWHPSTSSGQANKVINILDVTSRGDVSPQTKETSGTIRKIDGDVAVATGKCYLVLKQIQLEGGKEMDARDFINGHPDFPNSVLE